VNILAEADRLTEGDRNHVYGHPADDFACTVAMWRAYLLRRFDVDIDLQPEDFAQMMVLTKVSRLANTPWHTDSLVDEAGYARTHQMILDRRGNGDVV